MVLPFCKKNQRRSFPEKIHLKMIDILDRILERVPTILFTFMETFRRFHILLSSEKTHETQYIELRFDFFFNLFGWRYSTFEESSILCTIQLSGTVFRGVPERQLRKLFFH